ncbi:GerAB/ArcD/ProY family transporter [Paenibacillus albicereus]|uniref:GerAB/ArcD/ProY family transporter n=1 Tax=Paenibacillus albicereus TaxID=2726185 RepID=A0A6H2GY49_9BACL|nr:GerAB/ArcD/ProY family transporter [Paenibacillus albicereus]QJC52340.1 GerAB/ArcD/ProY family transporter [Paenibacillus albicereus]
MDNRGVSAGQIAIFLILFCIGSTPMFELGIEAGQDSWIALSAAAAAGLGVLWVYRTLQNRAPEEDLAGLFKLHFGKALGTLLGIAFALLIAYESMRNVRDFGELTAMTLLPETPLWCTMLLIVGIGFYTVTKGVDTFFRIAQVLLPVLAGSYMLLLVLLLASGRIDPDRLRPVLEHGPMPVLQAAFPNLIAFPFSQTIVLLVFWKYAAANKQTGAASYAAYGLVAIFLIAVNAVIMMVLGPAMASIKALPTLEAVELIRLANFIERLDILVTLLLYIGLYVKISALYLASALLLRSACRLPLPAGAIGLGALIYGTSFLEPTNTFHLWLGLELGLKLTPFYQLVLPGIMLLTGVGWVKRKAERQRKKKAGEGQGGAEPAPRAQPSA